MKKNILSYIIISLIMLLIPYVNVYAYDFSLQFNVDDYKCNKWTKQGDVNICTDSAQYYYQLNSSTHFKKTTSGEIVYCYDKDLLFPAVFASDEGNPKRGDYKAYTYYIIFKSYLKWNCNKMTGDEANKLKYVIGTGLHSNPSDNNNIYYNNNKLNDTKVTATSSSCQNTSNTGCDMYQKYYETQQKIWRISSSPNKKNYSCSDGDDDGICKKTDLYINLKNLEIYLNIDQNDNIMFVDKDDDNYYRSNKVTVSVNMNNNDLPENFKISLDLPSGFSVYKDDGKTLISDNKVKPGDTIIFKADKNTKTGSKEIKAYYSYTYYNGDLYKCEPNIGKKNEKIDYYNTNPYYIQDIIYYEPYEETKSISASLTLKIGYKCPVVDEITEGNLTCNVDKNYTSECDHLTISKSNYEYNKEKYNFTANIKLTQTGNIVSVLNPEITYSGGGFNFDIMYYNEISWDYYDDNKSCKKNGKDCIKELDTLIENELLEKIKKLSDFQNNIEIGNINFNNTEMYDGKTLSKTCEGMDKFEDKKIKSVCVFTFQKEELSDYSGSVSKITNTLNVKNKHYTPLSYVGDYTINATISGFSRLKDNAGKNDSSDKTKPWFGTWEDTFTDCKINLYPLYTAPPSTPNDPGNPPTKTTNVFIYRPIDITNPFPNRNAGMNWFEWYNDKANKQRLEASYNKDSLQYQITLDAEATGKIKAYNRDTTNNGTYLDWTTINAQGKSSFIDDAEISKYFDKKRINIK